MSRPTQLPGARRPGAPAPARSSQSEELQKLPLFVEDGEDVDIDPANASRGQIEDEMVTITGVKLVTQNWQKKDGTIPEGSVPEVHLHVFYKREDDSDEDKPYREQYKYATAHLYAPNKEGTFIKIRKERLRPGATAPIPRRTAPAVLFLQSITDASEFGKNLVAKI